MSPSYQSSTAAFVSTTSSTCSTIASPTTDPNWSKTGNAFVAYQSSTGIDRVIPTHQSFPLPPNAIHHPRGPLDEGAVRRAVHRLEIGFPAMHKTVNYVETLTELQELTPQPNEPHGHVFIVKMAQGRYFVGFSPFQDDKALFSYASIQSSPWLSQFMPEHLENLLWKQGSARDAMHLREALVFIFGDLVRGLGLPEDRPLNPCELLKNRMSYAQYLSRCAFCFVIAHHTSQCVTEMAQVCRQTMRFSTSVTGHYTLADSQNQDCQRTKRYRSSAGNESDMSIDQPLPYPMNLMPDSISQQSKRTQSHQESINLSICRRRY